MMDFLPSFSEISASCYGHDMATKLLRHGPSQVPWMHLLTASKGGRVSWKSCSAGIRETQEYLNHSTQEQSPGDFHPNRQILLCIQAGACHTCSTVVFSSQGGTWPRGEGGVGVGEKRTTQALSAHSVSGLERARAHWGALIPALGLCLSPAHSRGKVPEHGRTRTVPAL